MQAVISTKALTGWMGPMGWDGMPALANQVQGQVSCN